jgi:hypothetical protein
MKKKRVFHVTEFIEGFFVIMPTHHWIVASMPLVVCLPQFVNPGIALPMQVNEESCTEALLILLLYSTFCIVINPYARGTVFNEDILYYVILL